MIGNRPLVSVVMAVWNGMPYLPAAISSILDQTLSDFELIVIDDGSTDSSLNYLEAVCDKRLVIVSQAQRGPGASANRGIGLAKGKYLARMDADDISLPQRLERQACFLESNSDSKTVGCQLAFISGSKTLNAPKMPLDHAGILQRFYSGRIGLSNPCLMTHVELASKTLYRIEGAGEDVDFFFRLAERGCCANLPEVLYNYRIHAASASVQAAEHIRRGACFARESAKARQAGRAEISFEMFCHNWSRRSLPEKAMGSLADWSHLQYRRSLIERGAGRTLRGFLHMVAAGICRPKLGVKFLSNAVRSYFT